MFDIGTGLRLLLIGVVLASTGCREPNVLPAELAAPESGAADHADGVVPAEPGTRVAGGNPDPDITLDLSMGFQSSSMCNIEFIDGKELDGRPLPIADSAQVQGWLGSDGATEPSMPMLVLADAHGSIVRSVAVSLDVERPDVRDAFPSQPRLFAKGFAQTLDAAGLAGGDYHLFLAYASGSERFVCDNGRFVAIR